MHSVIWCMFRLHFIHYHSNMLLIFKIQFIFVLVVVNCWELVNCLNEIFCVFFFKIKVCFWTIKIPQFQICSTFVSCFFCLRCIGQQQTKNHYMVHISPLIVWSRYDSWWIQRLILITKIDEISYLYETTGVFSMKY